MNLTEHFTLEELIVSRTAVAQDIDNTPSPAHHSNLQRLARKLEECRLIVGPIIVKSGYRSPALNRAVGGKEDPPSQHMDGCAADILAPRFGSPREVAHALKASGIQLDQLILEFNAWVHVSIPLPGEDWRHDVLTYNRINGRPSVVRGLA